MFVFRWTFDKSHNFLTIRWAQKVLHLTERRLSPALLESASPKGAVSNSTMICLPTTLCLASGLRQMHTCFLIRQLFPFCPVNFPGFFHWRVSIGKARNTDCDPCSLANCTCIRQEKASQADMQVRDSFCTWACLGSNVPILLWVNPQSHR